MGDRDLSVSESFEQQITNGRAGGYQIAARPSIYTEQFERVCPYYISFGMSYDDFWNGDCEMAKMYRRAHHIRNVEANDKAWLQGFYVYRAIGALAPALKAFSKGRAQAYMDKPLEMRDPELVAEEAKREQKKKDKEAGNKARAIMEMWAVGFNEKWEKMEKKKEETTAMNGGETDGRCENKRN